MPEKKFSNGNKQVDATPVKSFFVSMLTRDITLPYAILDLLDNCVDGILRTTNSGHGNTPYKGFKAEIDFDKDSFCIHDNCGGIPWNLSDYAFRMGRPAGRGEKLIGTVGTYGIGMKRAIFKIGKNCSITTKNGKDSYEINITPKWILDEGDWRLPVERAKQSMKEDGTTIVIDKLYPGISAQFGHDKASFEADLTDKIATHYAFIIEKGFSVYVNQVAVKPRPTSLLFADPDRKTKKAIRPFIYKTNVDGVSVFLTVGFTRPIPSQEEVQDEQEEKKYSSLGAGWTVLCNDRAVLYCDKTEVTGWGEAGVPNYHTQFIAISGIVEFISDDPSKLPTTTTKRGINSSSSLYLQVKNKMREGMLLFTQYTNKWKTDIKQSKDHMRSGRALRLQEIKQVASNLSFMPVKGVIGGEQYKPSLPMPKPIEPNRIRISFVRKKHEIQLVGTYLFEDAEASASKIGERCFDEILKEAKK
ncbi:MAG: ATP-binding protein [Deltaproteobacteria bacterium]|nr:ATP-binding protein [Deltaproteobacteria bacterium]